MLKIQAKIFDKKMNIKSATFVFNTSWLLEQNQSRY